MNWNKHLLIALMASLTIAACKNDKQTDNPEPEQDQVEVKEEKKVDPVVIENAKSSVMVRLMTIPEINTMGRAVISAGLTDMLMGDGPYTIFAPSNDAFEGMEASAYSRILDPNNKEELIALLKNHVIATELGSAELLQQLKGGPVDFTALGGAKLVANMEDGDILLSDDSGTVSVVSKTDITADNGVIHVINTVMTTGPSPQED